MTDGNNDVQQRLDELEEALRVEYPTAETPGGGAQRLRLEVPEPWSLMTIGARGTGASDGRAVGPGGFGLLTTESFGAEIQGNTCIDTDGLTIVHAIGPGRFLTHADLGLASNRAMKLGTTEGNIELTAGEVPVNDPSFKVIPSMPVPAAPTVDTAGPRSATEGAKDAASALWNALEVPSGVHTLWGFLRSRSLSSGVAAGSFYARVAGVVNLVRTSWAVGEAAVAAVGLAAAGFDLDQLEAMDSHAPKAKIHGAGGVSLTSPESVSAFAPKISLTGRNTASLKAALKVSVKSAGYTSLYGAACTSVSSEGPAVLKSSASAATVSGEYAEVSAKNIAVVRSDGRLMVSGKTAVSVESPNVVLGGGYVGISSDREVEVEAPTVSTMARRENTISSGETVKIDARQKIQMNVGAARLEIADGEISLYPGGRQGSLVVDRGSMSVWGFKVERDRTRIRGNVDLG